MKKKRKQEKQSNFQDLDTKKVLSFPTRLCHVLFYLPSVAFFVKKFEFPAQISVLTKANPIQIS